LDFFFDFRHVDRRGVIFEIILILLLDDVLHLLLEVFDVGHFLRHFHSQLAAQLLHFLLERLDGSHQALVQLQEPLASVFQFIVGLLQIFHFLFLSIPSRLGCLPVFPFSSHDFFFFTQMSQPFPFLRTRSSVTQTLRIIGDFFIRGPRRGHPYETVGRWGKVEHFVFAVDITDMTK